MNRRFALPLIGLILVFSSHALADAPPDLSRIKYDSQCLTIDGKDTFLYSGSFHYFRCPKALWADRFQKMKDAGLNCVETYVAWNWHEQQPPAGLDDYSKIDMTDLTDWLDMAINRFGFYVILRPGPYICAEWDGGGYPQWLVTKKPAGAPVHWLRSDDPAYLAWCKHWYAAVAKATVPFQITHMPAGKPGVILWQIENEYDYAAFPPEVKLHQLQALAHDSRDLGIDIPLITCQTTNPLYRRDPYLLQNVIECRNTYPRFDAQGEFRALRELAGYQPEKPKMITELQGGWFSDVGGHLSQDIGLTSQQITHVTLQAWALGYTATNYYMMFGGTNIGDWGSAFRTTSYDYDAPIRECGGVGPRYFAVEAMANFLKLHSTELQRSELVFSFAPPSSDLYVFLRKAKNGARFLFLLNNLQHDRTKGTLHLTTENGGIDADIAYSLDPFDAKVLYIPAGESNPSNGVWYPQAALPPARPTNLPSTIAITTGRRQFDPGPSENAWRDLPPGASVEDMGIFDRRFVYYRAAVNPPTQTGAALMAELPGQDSVIVQLNGQPQDVSRQGRGWVITPLTNVQATSNRLLVLYENGGRENGGYGINNRCGLINADVRPSTDAPLAITDAFLDIDEGIDSADPDDHAPSLEKVRIGGRADQIPSGHLGIFQIPIDISPAEMAVIGTRTLSFGSISGDHTVYLNSHELSETDSNHYDISGLLHEGKNILAVIIVAGTRSAGIGGAITLDPATFQKTAIPWQIAGESAGTAGKWWDPNLNDSQWQSTAFPDSSPTLAAPTDLTWYRISFNLPAENPHVWVPWYLHLKGRGNGFIYLNGHALGRYWDVGPQWDFYLPECWLNFGKPNNVTICLRNTGANASIEAAAVCPYAHFAEFR